MAVQPTELLFVTDDGDNLASSLSEVAYHIHTASEPGQAMEALRDRRYELILLVDTVFGSEILSVVKEIKRRVPLVPVLVFSRSTDPAYQTDLMESGADDVLLPEIPADELERRLRLILRQRRHNQTLAQRNQNLQAITVVARRLHSATEPLELIRDTIDLASATFKLYGMAIILGEGESFQLYAGRENGATNGGLYESQVTLKDYDPFRRVIQSGIVQVFRTIVADPYYVPIPVLPSPESAIVIPLNYQEHKFGAMAVFGTAQHPLNHDDLLIYELFASQFTLALHNARHYHSQRISAQSSQHIIRAWQRFINLHSFADITQNLRELVEDIPNVANALVWMYDNNVESPGTIVQATSEQAVQVFRELEAAGKIDEFIKLLDDNHFQPVSLYLGMGQSDPLRGLFAALNGQQLTVVPIADAARFSGGIIASVINSRQYSAEDAKLLIVSLAHAAGQALERSTLIARTVEKSSQLETMLLSISEGFFSVDDKGYVVFCNPQFTELTGINPSEVLDEESGTLLKAIAEQTEDGEWVQSQLKDAIDRVLGGHPQGSDDYPIVEISLINPDRDLHIEFMQIPDVTGVSSSWAGIIRSNTRFKSMFSMQALLLDKMSERIRVPYAQVRGLITTLNEQHSRFTHRERSRFLRQIEESVEDLGRLWDNFLQMYHLEIAGLSLSREEADLYDLVQRVLESRLFGDQRRQVHVEAPARLPLVEFDDLRLEQALANVLHNAFKFSSAGAPVHLSIETQGSDEVRVVIRDQGMGIPADELEKVFEPFYQASNNATEEGAGLGLYLTRQIVRRHGGNIRVESEPGKGTTFTISLPVVAGEPVFVHPTRPAAAPPPVSVAVPAMPDAQLRIPSRGPVGRRVTDRQPQTIMVVGKESSLLTRLSNQLDDQGYELIEFASGEEALRDVNTVRLDLILLDVNLPDANGLDICERLCKRTEVPIILLADDPSEPEKVRALLLGADDYIDDSVGDDELMARVNVIFKRRRIPDRTREPLDLGNLFVDFARREVYLNNAPLELTRIEYDLLHTLAVNQGQVLTHKQLLEKVWGPEYQGETQYLWVNVSRLRKKLEPTLDSPRYIHTQPGVGYVFRAG